MVEVVRAVGGVWSGRVVEVARMVWGYVRAGKLFWLEPKLLHNPKSSFKVQKCEDFAPNCEDFVKNATRTLLLLGFIFCF